MTLDLRTFKTQLRIPTREQYAYIEISVEGTLKEIVDTYERATDIYTYWDPKKPNDGIEPNVVIEVQK